MNFGGGGGGPSATAGPDQQDVQTEQLAFQTLAPDSTLRLLPSAWPNDAPPVTTASLLSLAPTKGLVAAAAPDALVIAKTESVRQTLIQGPLGDNGVKSFQPETTIAIPRVNQVCFSSDESCLAIAAEQGGGLAVYDTNAILSGSKEPAFQLSTNGQSVKHLIPNPNSAPDLARYFAIVTEQGNLLLADLKEQKLINTASGNAVFQEGIYCACWSRLGKQIIAGRNDGTAVQVDPQGTVKATIPEPPQLAGWKNPNSNAHPLTSIYWLDTNDFLLIHTPINAAGAMAEDDSIYHLARRERAASQAWTFMRFTDPCSAFGPERKPAHHFIQRLRDWQPGLNDLLIIASTASSDVGSFTLSDTPLGDDAMDGWANTMPPDDGRMSIPISLDMSGDTSPVGMALDLSVTEKAPRPIPTDESMDQSPVELPALFILNNEGRLSAWYVVYRPSIRKAIRYPDLVAAGGPRALGEQKQATPAQTPQSSTATNAASPFGSTNAAVQPPARPLTFGSASPAPAFGGPTTLGANKSPWGNSTASPAAATSFGKPSFGTPSVPGGGSAFGSASALGGHRASPWGTQPAVSSPLTGGGNTFGGPLGQASPFAGFASSAKPAASPFAALGSKSEEETNSSPFETLRSKSGEDTITSAFGVYAVKERQLNTFATKPDLPAEPSGSTVSFGNGSSFGTGSSTFGEPSFSFGKPSAPPSREDSVNTGTTQPQSGLFGSGGDFKLGSTFKGDGSAKDDDKSKAGAGAGLFGSMFGSTLGETVQKAEPLVTSESSKPAPASGSGGTSSGGASKTSDEPTTPVKEEPGTEITPNLRDIPAAKTTPPPAQKLATKAPIDDAPLPPDPATWKPKPGALPAPVPPGFDFSQKSTEKVEETEPEAAPLPPDFTTAESAPEAAPLPSDFTTTESAPEAAPLPPDFTTSTSSKSTEGAAEQPLAGSPPVDLGGARFSDDAASPQEGLPADDEDHEDDGEWDDEDEEDEEGEEDEGDEEYEEDEGDEEDEEDEEDEDGEGSESEEVPPISDPAAYNAFTARITPASPKQDRGSKTTPPSTEKKSYTPAGMPAPSVVLAPHRRATDSLRSPSPIRSATSPLGTSSRSITHQAVSSAASLAASTLSKELPARIAVAPAQLVQRDKSTRQEKPIVPERGDLEDEEAAQVKAILAGPIHPTKELPAFLAHQDYLSSGVKASGDKPGLGGQIERVYRDINSMIDTVALNARSMKAFVQGHVQLKADHERTREDLEEEENWAFEEIQDLAELVDGIGEELDDGQLVDVRGKLDSLRVEEQEMARTKQRGAEIRKQVQSHTDPKHKALQAAADLPLEAQAQQVELRQAAQKVQALLANAEEQLSLLRAELASLSSSTKGSRAAVPTVEAVTNTILKMTGMIEKKSGDIDVLEAQIRRLGGPGALHGISSGTYEEDLAASMRASRISHGSPITIRTPKLRWTGKTSIYDSPTAQRGSPGLRGSRQGTDGLRRSLFDVPDAEMEAYVQRKERRRNVSAALREQIEARGTRVVKIGS